MKIENNVIYGGNYDKKFENISFGEFILRSLNKGGYCEYLINAKSGLTWTYADVLRETKKFANSFHTFDIKRNDKIAIISENRHEIAAIHFAAFCLNSIVAPINFAYTTMEIRHALNLTQPKIIFVSNLSAKNSIDACKELKFVKKVVNFDDRSFVNFIQKYHCNDFNLEEIVKQQIDIYTQSLPKGCELTQGNLFFTLGQYHNIQQTFKHFKRFNRTLNIAPWFHVIGFANLFLSLFSSQFSCVYIPKFNPHLFLRTIEKYKIVNILAPPPIVILLAKSPLVDQYDLSSLRLLSSGGASLTEEIENEIKSRFKSNLQIFQTYGMTETLTLTAYHKLENPIQKSIGKVLKGVYAKVIDNDGVALGPNKAGELCFKGPNIMKEYINNAKATAETIDKDDFLHTGDLGYYDENFNFFIVDRLKELIKYKAYQVAPAEIEGLFLSHPKIKDAGVIGIPNDVVGELPFAFVVKLPEVELTEKEVQDFIKENASNAKWLRGGVEFVDEIPKNPSGKILRRELREAYKISKAKL
ncbi:hypothetical protein PVAND_004477 [Polypedilum vanderplanki]|uniref:Uncharacterized protein n=1 Tax=Polypedilum vanderplanki TaxID=319348 RepID=A0A9J6BY87_POLVA|nr:hypothetical protein PVAND_004477 [Polypedilum vanderplanki]